MTEFLPPALILIVAAFVIGPSRGVFRDAVVLGAPLLSWLTAGLGIFLLLLSWSGDDHRH